MESSPVTEALELLGRHRYVALRTFRRDGTPIESPMWFAVSAGSLFVRTQAESVKRKRMTNNPNVEMRPSNVKGEIVGDSVLKGDATVLEGEAAEAGDRLLRERYGWQYNVVPMLPTPGLPTAKVTLAWSERVRMMRAKTLWNSYVIIRIDPTHT